MSDDEIRQCVCCKEERPLDQFPPKSVSKWFDFCYSCLDEIEAIDGVMQTQREAFGNG